MKKVIGGVFLILIMISTFSFAAYPADLEEAELKELQNSGEEIELISAEIMDETEIIQDDVYKMEDEVTIQEAIDGNVYVMAKNVKIENAKIYGNLYIMAEKVEVENSEIDGSVYVMGEEMNFSGMANDVYALGKKLNFNPNSHIWRSAKVAGESINMEGNVGRNFYVGAKNLSITDKATIEGKLDYTSDKEGNISNEAKIGEVQFRQEKQDDNKKQESNIMKYIYEVIKVAFQTLIVVLIILFGINKFKTLKRTDNVGMDFLKDMGKGALVLIFVPIISILLMISIIGIGFGLVFLAIYIVLLYIAMPITSVEIAHRILAKQEESEIKKGRMIGLAILISLVIWLIKFIPVIGGIVRFILVLIGLGVICTLIFQKNKKEEINEN